MSLKNQLTTSDYLDHEEFLRFTREMHRDGLYFWEMYALLSFCSACRASDVLNFKWSDILDRHDCVVIEKKTKKSRVVTFNQTTRNKWKEMYRLFGSPDPKQYIFAVKPDGGPITIQYVNQKLKKLKYKYRLNIQNFSTHTFRKTFGRYVYEKFNRSAESLILLNKILNHTSIQVTKTYIGITKDEIDGIYNSIAI
jgi:integrase